MNLKAWYTINIPLIISGILIDFNKFIYHVILKNLVFLKLINVIFMFISFYVYILFKKNYSDLYYKDNILLWIYYIITS